MKVAVIMIVALALIGLAVYSVDASTIDSTVDFNAVGLVSTSSNLEGSGCGNIYAMTSNTFGRSDLTYSNAVNGVAMNTVLTSKGGSIGTSSSMYNFVWDEGTKTCAGGICTETPSRSTVTFGQSNVLLRGMGTVSTVTQPDTFNISANGNGRFDRTVGVLDINGNTDNTSCKMLNEFGYNDRVQINGGFDVTSRFTYTR